MTVCRLMLLNKVNSKLKSTTVTCLIGFVRLALIALNLLADDRPSIAPYRDLLCRLCKG